MAKKAAAPRMTQQDRKWQAESDLRTVQAFAELKSSPARLAAAQKVLQEQLKAFSAVKKVK